MKLYNTIYFILIVLLCGCFNASGANGKAAGEPFVLVIDPGHGGKDYGAVGKITNEKTINLDVALLVGKKLEKAFEKDLKLVYTRSTDKYLSLRERANLANKAHGNLFVSIHVNSVDKRNRNRASIKGASVYTLGLHRSADNLDVAKRENAVMTLDDNFEETYEGFDPESAESYIIFELSQNLHMAQSVRLADDIQHRLVSQAGRADRGVRQAGFWVLWATGMPSVLIELDFICNPDQERFLASASGKEKLAKAIASSLSRYIASSLGRAVPAVVDIHADETDDEAADEITPDQPVQTVTPIVSSETSSPVYKIQFLTSSKKINVSSSELKGLKDVDYYVDRGVYKYTTGSFSSKDEAQKALRSVRQKFNSAFVVKFIDGRRVE